MVDNTSDIDDGVGRYASRIRVNRKVITLTPDGNKQRLVPLLYSFWKDIAPPEWLDKLNSPEHQESREKLNEASKMGAQFVQDSVSYSRNQDPKATYKSEIGLADLTNPDIIRKDLGPKVPTLQPMHRIFELDDLEHLRGLSLIHISEPTRPY